MAEQANCDEVKAAYVWENARINDWVGNITANPAPAGNAIAKKFEDIWKDYFQEIVASNGDAITIFTVANDNQGKTAIKKFNRKYLPARPLGKVAGISDGEAFVSKYYASLAASIDLEVEASEAIREHLRRP